MSGHNLVRWEEITKGGMPQFVVSRPMTWINQRLETGDPFPGTDERRTRNLYELNRIAVAPVQNLPAKKTKKGR
jgi:hypothetical protein